VEPKLLAGKGVNSDRSQLRPLPSFRPYSASLRTGFAPFRTLLPAKAGLQHLFKTLVYKQILTFIIQS